MKYRICSLVVALMVSCNNFANDWLDAKSAIDRNDMNQLQALITKNSQLLSGVFNGKTLLMYAGEKDCADGVELCVKSGANKEQQDSEGRTALVYAVANGAIHATKQFIALKANINSQDAYKNTPAHHALDKFMIAKKQGLPVAGEKNNILNILHVVLSAEPNLFLQNHNGSSVRAIIKYRLNSEDAALILSGIPSASKL